MVENTATQLSHSNANILARFQTEAVGLDRWNPVRESTCAVVEVPYSLAKAASH